MNFTRKYYTQRRGDAEIAEKNILRGVSLCKTDKFDKLVIYSGGKYYYLFRRTVLPKIRTLPSGEK